VLEVGVKRLLGVHDSGGVHDAGRGVDVLGEEVRLVG
jgi:hypothetical protein